VVTGAGGFVGAHLTRALAWAGRAVLATDVRPALAPWVMAAERRARTGQYISTPPLTFRHSPVM
jgi:nucleoside-diphosphate-sugar epimerase